MRLATTIYLLSLTIVSCAQPAPEGPGQEPKEEACEMAYFYFSMTDFRELRKYYKATNQDYPYQINGYYFTSKQNSDECLEEYAAIYPDVYLTDSCCTQECDLTRHGRPELPDPQCATTYYYYSPRHHAELARKYYEAYGTTYTPQQVNGSSYTIEWQDKKYLSLYRADYPDATIIDSCCVYDCIVTRLRQ